MKRNVLFLSGTDKISGAENVFKDYAISSVYRDSIFLLSSSIKEVEDFYQSFLKNTNSYSGLNPVNATSSKFSIAPKLNKLYNIITSSLYIKALVKKNNCDLVVANNTRDIVYSIFLNKRNLFYLFIHDMMVKKTINAYLIMIFDKKVDKYIVVSEAVKNSLLELGISSNRILLQYNGLPFYENKKNKLSKDIKIGFVGALIERKSPLSFLRLFEDANFEGVMAFNYYDNEILSELKNIIECNNLNVKLVGKISRDEVNNLLQEIDYLMVPSIEDPLPTVVLESFNNGTPVIGRNIDGIPEMIVDGINGFLFKDDAEIKNIVDKIKQVDNEEYTMLSTNANNLIRTKFNIQNKIKTLDKLFFE